jgi:5'-nucleotidase / UDP-sugar diphosphatase
MGDKMKKFLKVFSMSLAIVIIVIIAPLILHKGFAAENQKSITVLFTHDMHDHLLPSQVQKNGQVLELGGYARLENEIKTEKKINPNALLLDAGDYSMGTLFQSIYTSDAPELRIMGQMGYDVTTFGNHEYDFKAAGLAASLNAAKSSGETLPQIVQCNVAFPKDKNGILSKSLADLKQAMNNYGVKDYTILQRNGFKIGVFGLIGKDAAADSPMAGVEFTDPVENAKRVVKILKDKEKVDLIICLSHSGVWTQESKSEDEILAKKVPDIDIIISGHTHTILDKPIIVGKTIIGSCGEYAENLGIINISQDVKKGWNLDNYKLVQIDDSLSNDPQISKTISNFKEIVQKKYLNNFNMKFDEVIANSPFNFVALSELEKKHAEDKLGNLISDSYIYAVKKAEGSNYEPVTAAIIPAGTIRGSFVKGDITAADAFTVSSLGIGEDNISGYPLISVYLTGKELKTVCEVDASISPIMPDAQLYMSGLNFRFNPNRLILDKVTDVTLTNKNGGFDKINDTKLYRVVAGLYSGQMLSAVGKKSFGLLSIVPKTKEGKPIIDFNTQIINDTRSGTSKEIKEWQAIAEYLQSFNKVNGISQIPEYYNATHGRKIVDNNHNMLAIISNPNGFAIAVSSIVIVFTAIIVFVIVRIVTRKKRKNE